MIDRRDYFMDYLNRPEAREIFPREVAFVRSKTEIKRLTVPSFDLWVRLIEQHDDGTWNCFTSLFSKWQFNHRTIDVIFLEIDRPNIDKMNQACMMVEMALDQANLKYREYFTANRGKHYYIPIESVQLDNPSEAVKNWLKSKFPKNKFSGLKKNGCMTWIFDWQSFGRIHQMVRVPYAMHMKTKQYAFECQGPISDRMGIYHGKWETNYGIARELKEVDFPMHEGFSDIDYDTLKVPFLPECIQKMILTLDEVDYEHSAHLHLASFLRLAGYTPEQALDIFAQSPDFKTGMANYQINDIYKRELSPLKCRNVIDLGLCKYSISKRCPMFPYIVAYLLEYSRAKVTLINTDKQEQEVIGE